MAVKEPKTKPGEQSVEMFLGAIVDPLRQADARAIDALLAPITGETGTVWGAGIIGYGVYQSPTGPWPRIGFSPRKANTVLYVMQGLEGFAPQLEKLGRHTIGKSCIYIKRMADIDVSALAVLLQSAHDDMTRRYPAQT
jgi:hypothetical protein